MTRIFAVGLGAAVIALLSACGGSESPQAVKKSPSAADRAEALGLQSPVAGQAASTERPFARSGSIDVWVSLDQNSLARTRAVLAQTTGIERKRAQGATGAQGAAGRVEPAAIRNAMSDQRRSILAQQAVMSQRLASLGARELARVHVAHNAIAVSIDASQLAALRATPGVLRVRPVIHYELDLSETVPYVGATAVQTAGFDGTGVRVAVLDSGIDYTHKNLGGAGTAAAYAAAYGTGPGDALQTTRDGLFPTAKVVDGFDFVGEAWPSGARTEDDDPIDFQGHGSHVADIIAGRSTDGSRKGVAPGASLVAVKVCSAVATSCNGVALLLGMDFAMDPNGDSDLSDAVDVINLSLGSSYGQIEDDLSLAVSNAVAAGTIVVASAGNSADKPYVTGSPAMAPGVLSVAQTQVPSATAIGLLINSPPAIAGLYGNTSTLAWAPIGAGATGNVKTALATGAANNLACVPLTAGSLSGMVALVDRGSCNISAKVRNASDAGAVGVLIGLVAPGDAQTFSNGGDCPEPATGACKPSLVITQATASAIKGQLGTGVNVSLTPANTIALVGSMAGSSSRGPSMGLSGIKPEIGAPGASLSAQAGTGDGQTVFGGTSGAAPMVAGAAALVLSAKPALTPMELKALLMNNANTAVYTNPAVYPGQLAPITRIGGGELRVDRALAATGLAWDADALSATLAFGAIEAEKQTVLSRTLTVQNMTATARQYRLSHSYRYADDEAADAVRLIMPSVVNVPANGSATVKVQMLINPARLPAWTLNGGSRGGNGQLLNLLEVDGYVTLTDGAEQMNVPWHVLPRKASATSTGPFRAGRGGDNLQLKNVGAGDGAYELFSLVGSSPAGAFYPPAAPGDNIAVVDLKSVGVRYVPPGVYSATLGFLEFAISTHGRRSMPVYPGGFEVDIDTTGDGIPDFYVFQRENGGFGASGTSVVVVQNATTGAQIVRYFNNADLNSGNSVFLVQMADLGLSPGTTIGIDVLAYDNYFTGIVTDAIGGMRFTPGNARFSEATGTLPFGQVSPGASARVPFKRAVVPDTASSELGMLMMYPRNIDAESQEIRLP